MSQPSRQPTDPQAREKELLKAKQVSDAYYKLFPGLLFLNVFALSYVKEWKFDWVYWTVFATFSVPFFCLLYFHHRKYLTWTESKPYKGKQKPGSATVYAILVIVYALMLTPLLMAIHNQL